MALPRTRVNKGRGGRRSTFRGLAEEMDRGAHLLLALSEREDEQGLRECYSHKLAASR